MTFYIEVSEELSLSSLFWAIFLVFSIMENFDSRSGPLFFFLSLVFSMS